MFPFIESIKLLDGVFFRLGLHQKRINTVFEQHYPTEAVINLQQLLHAQAFPTKGLFKCRIVFSNTVELLEFVPYTPKTFNSLKLVQADIEPSQYKSVNRDSLNAAYAQRTTADDVLIVNRGLITDTWFANVALWNGTEWHTPKTPLIAGVQRADLINKGLLKTLDISPQMLQTYQKIRVFNALMEFGDVELKIQSLRF
jgi:4-amino-4-deoxychorismate lyase